MWNKTSSSSLGNATGGPSSASKSGPGGWHPTVLYLVGLVLAEVFILGFVSRHLLSR